MGAIPLVEAQGPVLNAYLAQFVPQAAQLQIRITDEAQATPDGNPAETDLHLRLTGDADTTADVLIGGSPALRLVARDVPWEEVPERLVRLLKAYQVERCGKDTFRTWARNLSDGDLRERLGLAGRSSGGR